RTKDGSWCHVETTYTALFDDPHIAGLVANTRDITERVEAEEALRRSELLYHTTIESMDEMIHVVTPDMRITLMNETFRRWCRALGVRDDAIGLKPREAYPFLPAEISRQYEEVFETGRILRTEDVVTLAGKDVICETRKIPVLAGGKVVRVVTVIRDVTEQRRGQEELLVKNSAMDSSINAIALADMNGDLTYVNDSFLKLWGYEEPSEVLGRSCLSFWEVPARARRALAASKELGDWAGEMAAQRKDGAAFHVEVSSSMVTGESGQPICMMAFFVDVTERKRAEAAMREANRKLVTAREQERKWVAGELHDSVGQALVALQLAIRAIGDTASDVQLKQRLAPATAQCDGMIQEIRGICRGLYPQTLESLGLYSALRQLAGDFRPQAHLQVRQSASVAKGRVGPDAEIALFRIAQEAVTNAIRHGQAGRITMSLSYAQGCAALSITDDGKGFDPAEAAGKGLGLTRMLERMRAASGDLEITSKPGRTRIRARVPTSLFVKPDDQQ
ncbi:hypothetical protein LCGC14_2106350, partial [marine sediment metagenome]